MVEAQFTILLKRGVVLYVGSRCAALLALYWTELHWKYSRGVGFLNWIELCKKGFESSCRLEDFRGLGQSGFI